MHHPLDPDLTCPVLQYDDDTLIRAGADPDSIFVLKSILGNFSSATGLTINYYKSTFVTVHVPPKDTRLMENTLGFWASSFPQTYLGLPLSPHKLRVSDYQPLLDSFDRYLAGWKAKILNSGGGG